MNPPYNEERSIEENVKFFSYAALFGGFFTNYARSGDVQMFFLTDFLQQVPYSLRCLQLVQQ
ncbi:hypothetical protein MF271_13255 [Deinococcus sp. KNUC1210]|uniref:hypothetical protein n=1 Tax=Deinococcus sp. KNUC1210 TaxID=2917691 RepID=UPI001EF09BCD|nr:hypothetical protein [Deinococcus sp. KNUC1210]ULH14931.1 hypothetical protein MF271_13255 [Deinococcus sp. KNUC1210]